jgi:hypothetical protein
LFREEQNKISFCECRLEASSLFLKQQGTARNLVTRVQPKPVWSASDKSSPSLSHWKLAQCRIVDVLLGNTQVPLHCQLSGAGIVALKITHWQSFSP